MRRIDFYVQHLVRHDAQEVRLTSGQPVTFRFAAGDRHSNAPLDHATLTQLVQEAAPRETLALLSKAGRATFTYTGVPGATVDIAIEQASAQQWTVVIAMQAPKAVAASTRETPKEAERSQAKPEVATPPEEPTKKSAPIQLAEGEPRIHRYLRRMIDLGASDLHMSSGEVPMVRLHGEIVPIEEGHAALTDAEIRKLLFEIVIPRAKEDFTTKNDADFAHTIEGLARFRANYFMDRKGMGAVFRQIPFTIMAPEKLGIPKQVLDLCWLSKGLVLVTGPTGSGKSTTLATLIDFINRNRKDHIITIEDPIEFVHENKGCLINQREIATHTQGFKSALRAALREDPDIVLVGEMRDLETISIAIETAETGHLVFGTLHTTTAPGTVDRIIDQFPADRQSQIRTMLSESLRGVIAQMLCKKVGGGRVAAYEVLVSNPAVSNLIREGKTYQLVSVMQTGRNLGMQTMNEHLLDLVKKGIVEPKEAFLKSNDKQQMKETFSKNNIPLDLSA